MTKEAYQDPLNRYICWKEDLKVVNEVINRMEANLNKESLEMYLLLAATSKEWTPFRFDVEVTELNCAIMEIESKGREAYAKQLQGDYFYLSEANECPRCRRHRLELGWTKNTQEVCDRCYDVLKKDKKL